MFHSFTFHQQNIVNITYCVERAGSLNVHTTILFNTLCHTSTLEGNALRSHSHKMTLVCFIVKDCRVDITNTTTAAAAGPTTTTDNNNIIVVVVLTITFLYINNMMAN